MNAYNEKIKQTARIYGVHYVDIAAPMSRWFGWNQYDAGKGHLNAQGDEWLADLMVAMIK